MATRILNLLLTLVLLTTVVCARIKSSQGTITPTKTVHLGGWSSTDGILEMLTSSVTSELDEFGVYSTIDLMSDNGIISYTSVSIPMTHSTDVVTKTSNQVIPSRTFIQTTESTVTAFSVETTLSYSNTTTVVAKMFTEVNEEKTNSMLVLLIACGVSIGVLTIGILLSIICICICLRCRWHYRQSSKYRVSKQRKKKTIAGITSENFYIKSIDLNTSSSELGICVQATKIDISDPVHEDKSDREDKSQECLTFQDDTSDNPIVAAKYASATPKVIIKDTHQEKHVEFQESLTAPDNSNVFQSRSQDKQVEGGDHDKTSLQEDTFDDVQVNQLCERSAQENVSQDNTNQQVVLENKGAEVLLSSDSITKEEHPLVPKNKFKISADLMQELNKHLVKDTKDKHTDTGSVIHQQTCSESGRQNSIDDGSNNKGALKSQHTGDASDEQKSTEIKVAIDENEMSVAESTRVSIHASSKAEIERASKEKMPNQQNSEVEVTPISMVASAGTPMEDLSAAIKEIAESNDDKKSFPKRLHKTLPVFSRQVKETLTIKPIKKDGSLPSNTNPILPARQYLEDIDFVSSEFDLFFRQKSKKPECHGGENESSMLRETDCDEDKEMAIGASQSLWNSTQGDDGQSTDFQPVTNTSLPSQNYQPLIRNDIEHSASESPHYCTVPSSASAAESLLTSSAMNSSQGHYQPLLTKGKFPPSQYDSVVLKPISTITLPADSNESPYQPLVFEGKSPDTECVYMPLKKEPKRKPRRFAIQNVSGTSKQVKVPVRLLPTPDKHVKTTVLSTRSEVFDSESPKTTEH